MARGQLLTMSSLTGSIGGLSFRDHNGSSIMYAKSKVAQFNGMRASVRRQILSFFAQRWRSLTAADRLSWEVGEYAGKRGYQLYMYCCINRYTISNVLLTRFSQPPSAPLMTVFTIAFIAGGTKNIGINNLPATNTAWGREIQATPPVSAGVRTVKTSLFRTLAVSTNANDGTVPLATAYNAQFGSAVGLAGDRAFVRYRYIHLATGCASPWIYQSTLFT